MGLEQPRHVRPVEVVHERIDVPLGRGAVVELIRVLVHVERQDRRSACERVRVIGRPLIDEATVTMRVGQEYPPGAAAQRLAGANELGSPTIDTPEVARQRLFESAVAHAVAAEALEVELVQDHRVGGDELLALQAVDREDRRLREIELGELCRDGVQPSHGASVVVLPVTDDELLREPCQLRRFERQWFDDVGHCVFSSKSRTGRDSGYECFAIRVPPGLAYEISPAIVRSPFTSSPRRRANRVLTTSCLRGPFASRRCAATRALARALVSRSRIMYSIT